MMREGGGRESFNASNFLPRSSISRCVWENADPKVTPTASWVTPNSSSSSSSCHTVFTPAKSHPCCFTLKILQMAATAHRSAVLIGQCIAHNTRNAAKVRVKRLIFDNNLNMIMDPLVDFQEFDLFEELEAVRVRLPRRIVKDHLDLFLTLTEEEFTSRFRLSKQTARSLLTQLHLPEANDSRGCPVPPHLQLLITLDGWQRMICSLQSLMLLKSRSSL
ncbi:uncharacterized protein LOC123517319 isoform X2 [Portunus trituberculatus]|uniref:uncharacterized protein LOC123517319 isoform X2 n=1 Tax=Portunus trituberculatus TaxID=210409 RepID=UPI001E1CD446|nr:uncharacterized protein LOC123517319 isoform X2 [Portunus trituberculatus]